MIGIDLNTDHLAVAETDASRQLTSTPGGRRWSPTARTSQRQAEALIGDAVASGGPVRPKEAGKPIVIEKLDFRQKKAVLEGESRRYSRMLSSFSYGKDQGLLPVPGLPGRCGSQPGEPGLQFGHWPGQVHGTIWAQCPSGCGPGAGPSFARLLRAHPPPAGLSRRQRRTCRLHRTCKEASEARVDVLGCGIGTAETGACSAAPAG